MPVSGSPIHQDHIRTVFAPVERVPSAGVSANEAHLLLIRPGDERRPSSASSSRWLWSRVEMRPMPIGISGARRSASHFCDRTAHDTGRRNVSRRGPRRVDQQVPPTARARKLCCRSRSIRPAGSSGDCGARVHRLKLRARTRRQKTPISHRLERPACADGVRSLPLNAREVAAVSALAVAPRSPDVEPAPKAGRVGLFLREFADAYVTKLEGVAAGVDRPDQLSHRADRMRAAAAAWMDVVPVALVSQQRSG